MEKTSNGVHVKTFDRKKLHVELVWIVFTRFICPGAEYL